MTIELPPELVPLVDALADSNGAVAVALGGSRATGTADAQSDWDFTLYYRGVPNLTAVERFGTVYPPGSWGRIMNGGAWLTIAGRKVDVMLRDADRVDEWSERAEAGIYEVDALLGYLAGAPTYMLLGERSLGRVLRGALPPARGFPERLAAAAPPRWRYHRDFTLLHARARAERGDVVGAIGQAAKAAIEEAHARLAERGEWALNEKRIVERAGLASVHELLARTPREPAPLIDWVGGVERTLAAR